MLASYTVTIAGRDDDVELLLRFISDHIRMFDIPPVTISSGTIGHRHHEIRFAVPSHCAPSAALVEQWLRPQFAGRATLTVKVIP